MTDVCYMMPQAFIKIPGPYFVKIVSLFLQMGQSIQEWVK